MESELNRSLISQSESSEQAILRRVFELRVQSLLKLGISSTPSLLASPSHAAPSSPFPS